MTGGPISGSGPTGAFGGNQVVKRIVFGEKAPAGRVIRGLRFAHEVSLSRCWQFRGQAAYNIASMKSCVKKYLAVEAIGPPQVLDIRSTNVAAFNDISENAPKVEAVYDEASRLISS